MSSVERWRPVPGYEGLYEVSSHGNVRALARRVRHYRGGTSLRRPRDPFVVTRRGYHSVALTDAKGVRRQVFVHRLVLLAFVGDAPDGKPQCNHKDGDRACNYVDNLEWCSASENQAHKFRVLGRTASNRVQVKVVFADGSVRTYPSVASMADDGFSPTRVSSLLTGKRRGTHKGCRFERIEPKGT